MTNLLTRFDSWLEDSGPAALVLREPLVPAEGPDGVLFPATYAASEDRTFRGGYNIDEFAQGENVCLVDSVGSQANRIEPIFMKGVYADMIPQVVVKAGDRRINLLEAGHRAGDAIVRCSGLQSDLRAAFRAVLGGDAEPLAKIAPTSLVFGVWDSRDTQAKLPRLISSTIRAFNVRKLSRSAQYVPAADYVKSGLLAEPADKKAKDAYAERGFVHVPASGSHGGVIATGGVRRDASIHLAALRLLNAKSKERSCELRRYVLGLALVAFTHPIASYLRQGCTLVLDASKKRELSLVFPDGRKEPADVTHESTVEYAQAAAKAFGVGERKEVEFAKALAEVDVAGEKENGKKSGDASDASATKNGRTSAKKRGKKK